MSENQADVDLEKAVRASILSYDQLEEKLASFLNEGGDDDDEDDAPVKSSKSKLADKKKKNRKKYKGDI